MKKFKIFIMIFVVKSDNTGYDLLTDNIFRGYSRNFTMISAINFNISTLVLQKWHSFKPKRRFSQVNMHTNNEIKTILHTQILSYDVFVM